MKKKTIQLRLRFRKRIQPNSKPIFSTAKIGLLGIIFLLANICPLTASVPDYNVKEFANDAKQKRATIEQRKKDRAAKRFLALAPWLVPALMTGGTMLTQLINNREARREGMAMREYNTPKNQMKRYEEAGLSPYLIYGAANAGNMSQPIPPREMPDFGKSIADYMAWTNFGEDIKSKRLQNSILAQQRSIMIDKKNQAFWDTISKQNKVARDTIDLYSDYPDLSPDTSSLTGEQYKNTANTGFRRKLNEVKMALALSTIDKTQAAIENLDQKTAIERVKRKYAEDFGMVGGDWTQGLGLIKSIPSMFKGARKLPAQEKALIDSYRKFKGDQYNRAANRFLFEQLKP